MKGGIILCSQLADAAAFGMVAERIGIGSEINPLAVAMFSVGGLGLVLSFKIVGAVALAWLGPRLGRWWVLPAIVGLAGAVTGVMELV